MPENTNSSYQERVEAKKERFAELAVKNREKSKTLESTNRSILDCMNGTPILIGHHSEKRHRKELDRIWNRTGKAIECDEKADYYERKAQNFGQNGIASDDPEAIAKLKTQIQSLEENHLFMKRANDQFRKGGWNAITDLTDEQKDEIKKYMTYGNSRVPFPSYSLSSSSANIKRVKQRIEELEKLSSQADERVETEAFTFYVADGRYCFEFPDIPQPEVRAFLKSKAFKWSRFRSAWVRKATANASYAKNSVISFLKTEIGEASS